MLSFIIMVIDLYNSAGMKYSRLQFLLFSLFSDRFLWLLWPDSTITHAIYAIHMKYEFSDCKTLTNFNEEYIISNNIVALPLSNCSLKELELCHHLFKLVKQKWMQKKKQQQHVGRWINNKKTMECWMKILCQNESLSYGFC